MLVGLGSGRVCTYKYMCNCENIYLYTVYIYIYIRIDVLGIQSFWTVPSTKIPEITTAMSYGCRMMLGPTHLGGWEHEFHPFSVGYHFRFLDGVVYIWISKTN